MTPKRQAQFVSTEGVFDYHHIKSSLFWGYYSISFENQTGFMAKPEKALLDYFYFRGIHTSLMFIEEMRLQNFEAINKEILHEYARRFQKPGMISLANQITQFIDKEASEFKKL
ncbi:MAG: hypothetical protein JW795_21930 [Chitinivibrionales bacterium]|nr:hypothetical protein [Chitinivibrionales bacterium]